MTQTAEKPRYYCCECPLTFKDDRAANAHHDETGHNQTWRAHFAYTERDALAARVAELEAERESRVEATPVPSPASGAFSDER